MSQWSKLNSAALRNGWRSGLEEKNASFLDAHNVEYDYESEKIPYFIPQTSNKYTPDFPILTLGTGKKIYIETKGRFMTADRKKHLLIKQQKPELDIRFVFSSLNSRLSKTSKTTYKMWCEKHGFLCAAKLIPEEWLYE